MPTNAAQTTWKSLLLVFLLGLATVAIGVATIVLLVVVAAAPLLLYLAFVLNHTGSVLLSLVGIAVGMLVGIALVVYLARWAWRRLTPSRRGASHWAGIVTGIACMIALAVVFAPTWLRDETSRIVTGKSLAQRAALPATEAEIRHLHDVVQPAAERGDPAAQFELGMALRHGAAGERPDEEAGGRWLHLSAVQPQGTEARLMLAANTMATPVPAGGRLVTEADVHDKVRALLAVRDAQPGPWLPVVWGTAGLAEQKTYGLDTEADEPARQAFAKAGDAGSRTLGIYAAMAYERTATSLSRAASAGRIPETDADSAWQRALDGYAKAGAVYEVLRLQRDTLPQRLRSLPVPAAIGHLPSPDAAFAARLQRFAVILNGDGLPQERVPSGGHNLAQIASLLALELAPDPSAIIKVQPTSRWAKTYDPLQRWLLARRHARGDCMAALELSKLTRDTKAPDITDADGNPNVPLEDAWALAWAEQADRCAQSASARDETSRRLQYLKALTPYERFARDEVANARAGVTAMLAGFKGGDPASAKK